MKRSRTIFCATLAAILSASPLALGEGVRFQAPSRSNQAQRVAETNQQFRAPGGAPIIQQLPARAAYPVTKAPASTPAPVPAPRLAQRSIKIPAPRPAPIQLAQQVPDLADGSEEVQRPEPAEGEVVEMPAPMGFEMGEAMEGYGAPCCEDGMCMGDCCGMGVCDPGCGCAEPVCGCPDPGCGVADPSCGCGEVGCGSCVGLPGPDYICFPVCVPRFKDLSLWAGVHGFRGPRDFYAPGSIVPGSRSDSNFGFQEGVNLSGRAPYIGFLFPQLSYQLGYQAVQSRLSGTVDDDADRAQNFVTAGLFRNVDSGLRYGVVWDYLRDDLYLETDFEQIRYEISLKSPQGREIGFWGANSVNTANVFGVDYETVDQYNIFYRCNFGKSSSARFWGGFTGDSEGIFGGEFISPLNDRWSVQSGFNYLIPDADPGLEGVTQESWNVGINLVWHLGRTARSCARSPHRPMFSVADNGWMFTDRTGSGIPFN